MTAEQDFVNYYNELADHALDLKKTVLDWKLISPKPACSKDLLTEQNDLEWMLLRVLRRRAYIEHIKLEKQPFKEAYDMSQKYRKLNEVNKKDPDDKE